MDDDIYKLTPTIAKEYLSLTENATITFLEGEVLDFLISLNTPVKFRQDFKDVLLGFTDNPLEVEPSQTLLTKRLNNVAENILIKGRITSIIERARTRNTISRFLFSLIDFDNLKLEDGKRRFIRKTLRAKDFTDPTITNIISNIDFHLETNKKQRKVLIKRKTKDGVILKKDEKKIYDDIKRKVKGNITQSNTNSIKKQISAETLNKQNEEKKAIWLPSDSRYQTARHDHQANYGKVFSLKEILILQSVPNCKCSYKIVN